MRPTFLGFEMGRKGLTTAQKALDITGHNISNMSTPGYTRQRVDQVSVSAFTYKSRFAGSRIDFAGQGVTITGVAQTRDAFLDRRFREQFSENYYYQQKTDILGDIAQVVDQYAASDGGLIKAVNTISDALQGLTGDKATDRSAINILRTAFQSMVQTLHDYDTKLNRVAEQQKYDLGVAAEEVNGMLAKLAGLNKQISDQLGLNLGDTEVYGPNELLDARNLLLDELSRYTDLETSTNEYGEFIVKMAGHVAVQGDVYQTIRMESMTGSPLVRLTWQDTGSDLNPLSGSLKAAVEMINGRGPDMQSRFESPEKGIPYYKDRLNAFAQTLANVMNGALPSSLDETGAPIQATPPDTPYKILLGAAIQDANGRTVVDPNAPVTAENISISDQWTANVTYALPSLTSMQNSTYFEKMNTLLKTDQSTSFFVRSQSFEGTFLEYITDIHNVCSGEESFTKGRLEATGAVADQLLNDREAISGVNKDEETSDMMMYQRSFQAVARLMTTMDDMLDQIINRMGRVGL